MMNVKETHSPVNAVSETGVHAPIDYYCLFKIVKYLDEN